MQRHQMLGALAVLAAAAVGIAGCSDKTAGAQKTLTYNEANGGEFHSFGQATKGRGPGPGGGFTLTLDLQDDSGSTVGGIHAFCLVTSQDGKGVCNGIVDVPNGQLDVVVGPTIGENAHGSITGGTGDYTGALGTFTSEQQTQNSGTVDTFTFTLP